ncbi:MAG TPA: Crp/Fnr family transcriptional regulator [Sphingomicrobium sp.]|nr:Crp/Fnr family transcriptional regulator [Sphingomicrobium sp.]
MNAVPDSAISLFLKRLRRRSALTVEEQAAIHKLNGRKHSYAAHTDIVAPGETVESACLVANGFVGRYDQRLDGQRQVTALYVPGDMCDLHSVVAPKASWSITAVTPATVVRVPHRQLRDLCVKYPSIALAFWRDGTADASIFAKWVGNLGRKSAKERITHLFCEMGLRLEAAGLGSRTSFELPITQSQLGDATGLTGVHVNRTLQDIRTKGLMSFSQGRTDIPNWDALAATAEFDPAYLMLEGPPQRIIPAAGGEDRVELLREGRT